MTRKTSSWKIAPLDHLWVRGSVSELDADKVKSGQKLKVIFPYSATDIDAKVEYIDKAIDPDTRSAKFRTSIPNPERRLKAGMFVRVLAGDSAQAGQDGHPPRGHGFGRSGRLRVRQEGRGPSSSLSVVRSSWPRKTTTSFWSPQPTRKTGDSSRARKSSRPAA